MKKLLVALGVWSIFLGSLTLWAQEEHKVPELENLATIEESKFDQPAKAVLAAPARAEVNTQVILNFDGTVSEEEPDLDIAVAPVGSRSKITKLYDVDKKLIYGMLVPDRPGSYRVAVIASVKSRDPPRDYAFADITVTAASLPDPTNDPLKPPPDKLPEPEDTLPVPPEPVKDAYGFHKFTVDILEGMPAKDPWRNYTMMIMNSFDKVIAEKDKYATATQFVEATSAEYKRQLGPNYKYWSHYYFSHLSKKLGETNAAGKLPSTVDAHVEVWREISQAFKLFPPIKKVTVSYP